MSTGADPAIDFDELIHRGVESDILDYKAPMNWSTMSRQARGKIVRHCLALANTRGGCVVIGVGEDASGRPSLFTGLDDAQLHSFDPTPVGDFVNHYADPPVHFEIERPRVDGRNYAVFVVHPFSGLPHVCRRGIDGELQTGVFYIRTPEASSRPATRAIEMHALVQRALRNQREELGRMLRGILYENRVEGGGANAEFKSRIDDSLNYFRRRKGSGRGELQFSLSAMPQNFNPEAYTLGRMRECIDRALSPRTQSGFIRPDELKNAYATNTALRWLSGDSPRMWQLFKSGLFHYLCRRPAADGKLDLRELTGFVCESVLFLGALYNELSGEDELISIELCLSPTADMQLCTAGRGEFICRIPEIKVAVQRSGGDLLGGGSAHAVRLTEEVATRFNLPSPELARIPKLVAEYFRTR